MTNVRPTFRLWKFSVVVKSCRRKNVAHKFHKPWNRPYKVTKRLFDITYEIKDKAKNNTKIVHFDRLKKAILTLVKLS